MTKQDEQVEFLYGAICGMVCVLKDDECFRNWTVPEITELLIDKMKEIRQ